MASAVQLLDAAIAKLDAMLQAAPPAQAAPSSSSKASATTAATEPSKAKKDSKPKSAPVETSAAPSGATEPELFGKALLKVAKVASVEELENSDKLYKLTVDVGAGEIKQVCAGLKKFITRDALLGSLVAVVLNLKPAKLAGNLSEAMILAADAEGGTIVRTLVPPPGAQPGDVVFCEGSEPSTSPVKTMKGDDWRNIVAKLSVQGSKATYAGVPLMTSTGHITLPGEIPDGSGIH